MARNRASRATNVDRQHSFAQIPSVKTPRSVFNRSCGVKTTFDAGELIPVFADEALPGDTMKMEMAAFARMATPLHPIMDNLHLDVFFFFVPLRLVWANFQRFMGEEKSPGDSTDFTVPQVVATAGGHGIGSLSDYLGIPTLVGNISTSVLFHRAYELIWDEWFRDENQQAAFEISLGDGPDPVANHVLIVKRGKRHDYFSSCLPFPQKGDPVTIAFGATAPVQSTGAIPRFEQTGVGNPGDLDTGISTGLAVSEFVGISTVFFQTGASGETGLEANLELTTGASINAIREAFQIQKLMEKDARGGTRYTEVIRSHFGVTSPDARLQRPEYLGGGSTRIVVSAVPQTSETNTTEQGNLAAFVTAGASFRGWAKSFTEHGIILGMVNVRADLNYQQGLNKMFSRLTRFDFYWPSFAHLGEQVVKNKEIFAQDDPLDELVFGYQERYAEYRYKPSIITGKMRSNSGTSLDTWHLAQDFASLPVLGENWIIDQPPISRVVAVPTEPDFLFDAFFDYKCVRPMPTYGVPGLIDHF